MSGIVSNVRPTPFVRWSRPAAIWAAVLAPLAVIALPARDLLADQERVHRIAALEHGRGAGSPDTALGPEQVHALARRAAELEARIETLRPLRLEPFEARALLMLAAREQGLALDRLELADSTGAEDAPGVSHWSASGRGRLVQWTRWIDELAALRMPVRVELAHFELETGGSLRARLELVLAGSSPPRPRAPHDEGAR